MKKKNKRKPKQKKTKFKKKKKRSKKPKKIIKNRKIRKKIRKEKKRKKNSVKTKFKLPTLNIKKVKIPQFKEQRKRLKKVTFQKVLDLLLEPVFRAYENFREKRKLEKLRKIALEKKEKERKIKEDRRLRYEIKEQELREEIKLAKERELDLKKFIREEQAILRKEQAEKRRHFLEEIKLDRKIESFRKRELQEIKNLEKLALKEQREYAEHRHTIELVLESFYRSANSLVFQLNKRYIPKHKSILRVIDRRYESNECFIRYDDSPDDDWLILIYLEDSDAKKGKIVVENKANPEKYETKSFETKEIFTYSDYLVDTMTAHIDRERQKKAS